MAEQGRVGARVPLDVDLEDRLIYGLTPIRFGYLVVGVVVAFVIGQAQSVPAPARMVVAGLVLLAAVGAAWGEWRGRGADRWAIDALVWASRNVEIRVGERRLTAAPLRRRIHCLWPASWLVVEDLDRASREGALAREIAAVATAPVRRRAIGRAGTLVAISSRARPRSALTARTRSARVVLVVPVEDASGSVEPDTAGFDLVVAMPPRGPGRALVVRELARRLSPQAG